MGNEGPEASALRLGMHWIANPVSQAWELGLAVQVLDGFDTSRSFRPDHHFHSHPFFPIDWTFGAFSDID